MWDEQQSSACGLNPFKHSQKSNSFTLLTLLILVSITECTDLNFFIIQEISCVFFHFILIMHSTNYNFCECVWLTKWPFETHLPALRV